MFPVLYLVLLGNLYLTSATDVIDALQASNTNSTDWGALKRMFRNESDTFLPPDKQVLPGIPNMAALDGIWQTVSETRSKFFVYSAYYERRVKQGRSIRVIGATKTHGSDSVWCHLWYNNEPLQTVSVLANIKIIRENKNYLYSACFVLCPLGDGMPVPLSVSIVRFLHSPPANHLLVNNNYHHQKMVANTSYSVQGALAVCVQPIHTYNKIMHLVEFIALNVELGVSHFDLYNYNTDPTIDCIIQNYVAKGLVSYHSWDLEIIKEEGIWLYGIHAALNDCLYRNMYRYSNVAIVDLDEFIIPKQADSLVKLIKYMDVNLGSKRPIGSYVFKNAFFFVEETNASSVDARNIESKLLTISKTNRRLRLNPHTERSKYICKPERTVETGNHFVWEHLYGFYDEYVWPDLAASQHYRLNKGGWPKDTTVFDNSTHRFREGLTRRVLEKWTELREKCGLPMWQDIL